MGKLHLAVMLMVILVGCRSGKRLHIIANSPYVDPRTGDLKHAPFQKRTSWWDVFFAKDEKDDDPVQLKRENLNGNDGSALSRSRK